MTVNVPDYIEPILLVASLMLWTSMLNYKLISRTNAKFIVKGEDMTGCFILFVTRLMIVSVTMISISVISIFITGKLMEIIIAVLGLISFLLMLNIERLPIWEEEK